MLKRPSPEIPLGFLIASLFWIGVVAWQSSYAPTENEKQKCYEDAVRNGHKSDECKSFWERTTSDPVAFFTFTLTAVTLALGAISVRQFHYLKRSDVTARLSAKAAQQAADALPVVERAYVYPMIVSAGAARQCIENALVYYLADPDKNDEPIPETAEITFKLKNYGKTPAILKSAFAAYGVPPTGAEIGLAIPEAILGEMETTSELFSKMQVGITYNQARHIMAYTASLVFSGEITYDDIWGNELKTTFLFAWDKDIQRMALRFVETEATPKSI
jgi:hypothetical protein